MNISDIASINDAAMFDSRQQMLWYGAQKMTVMLIEHTPNVEESGFMGAIISDWMSGMTPEEKKMAIQFMEGIVRNVSAFITKLEAQRRVDQE